MSELEQQSPSVLFKSLADDTRLRTLLLLLEEGELCVCEMTAALELSQPKISRHLAQLRNAGLIADRRQGQWVFYGLHPALPDWIRQVLVNTFKANQSWFQADLQRLRQMGDRPARQAAIC